MKTKALRKTTSALFGSLALMLSAASALLAEEAMEAMEELAFDIVGFNGRGLYYGIEEFGFDAKGRPMANIRIYDLRKDAEIDRSPISYVEQEKIPEGVTKAQAIDRARRGVYRKAQRIIRFLSLVPRGHIIYAKKGERPKALQLATPPLSGMITVETFPLPSERCKGVETKGLRVKITRMDGEELLHEDKSLGKDRGCPVDYFVRAANVYEPYADSVALAVVLGALQPKGQKPQVHNTVIGHVWIRGMKKSAQ